MWGQGHRLWLRSLRFEHKEDQWALEDCLLALEHVEERLRALDARIEHTSLGPRYASAVAALRCFRGIDTLTAMCLVAEWHSFMRFDSARGLMAYLGLVPSEHSSGGKEHRGEITKASNRHARRLLIEAAWHYRHHPSTLSLRKRREGQPAKIIAIADTAMLRLHRRFNRIPSAASPGPRSPSPSPVSSPASSGPPCATTPRRRTHTTSPLPPHPVLGDLSRRMKVGTTQRMRVAALRQGGFASSTRAIRARPLSTEDGTAALRSGATRVYQSDSSSKRLTFTVVSDPQGGPTTATT
jgi:hypothetical protein